MRTIDGIEVINALVDDELVVTQEDIDKAIPLDHHNCALGVAWKRGQTDLQDVLVYKSRAFKLKEQFGYLKWFRYNVSTAIKIQQAILDNGGKFSPGKYIFKVMNKSQRKPGQQGSDKDPNKPRPTPTLVKAKPRPTPMRSNAPTQNT
jgi:hypothetical protein